MANIRYTVKLMTAAGEVLVKDFFGQSVAEVREQVSASGHFIVDVRRAEKILANIKILSTSSLVVFNQKLLALLKAGIPLLQALEMLCTYCDDNELRISLERIVTLLREGLPFSEALEKVGNFPQVYLANVVAGERSGSLPDVISRWLVFQKFAQNSRRRIIESLIYPAFLAVVMVLSTIVIINVVLPSFAKLYADSSITMPVATMVLLHIGEFMRSTIYIQVILFVGLIFFMRWLFTTVAGNRLWDRFVLTIPKIGTLYHMYYSSVFTRTLSILLSSGMPIVQALEVLQRTTPSASMQLRLVKVLELVRAGSPLYLSLEEADLLHPLSVEMTRVGEQSSALPDMLDYVADFFDQEVEKATTVVTTLAGPIMILIMGIMVMGLLLAVYAPLFEVNSLVQ